MKDNDPNLLVIPNKRIDPLNILPFFMALGVPVGVSIAGVFALVLFTRFDDFDSVFVSIGGGLACYG